MTGAQASSLAIGSRDAGLCQRGRLRSGRIRPSMSFWTWLKSPANHRGQILDLLVFLVNLFLLGPFTNLLQRLGQGFSANDNLASQELALIILAAFASYTLGAILKRPPLHERIGALPSPDYAGCLYV